MSDLFIPFDNNPASVSVKTGSYTIPAGYYANVVVTCENNGAFYIDSNIAFEGTERLRVTGSLSSSTYTIQSGYVWRGIIDATASITIDGVITVSSGAAALYCELYGGAQITGTGAYAGWAEKLGTQGDGTFWVPTGTALTVFGTVKYTVSLYPILV